MGRNRKDRIECYKPYPGRKPLHDPISSEVPSSKSSDLSLEHGVISGKRQYKETMEGATTGKD